MGQGGLVKSGMPPETFEQLLDRAAALSGIDSGYWDIWGRHHVAPAAVKQAILASAGIASGSTEELERALAERTRREWTRLAPPSLVVSQADPHQLPISLPAELAAQIAAITIQRENGPSEALEVKLADLAETESIELDGRKWIRKAAPLPRDLPLGYHQITVTVGGEPAQLTGATRYIVTPDRAWSPPGWGDGARAAGISFSLYGLRSAANWGCGDFRDLPGLIDWAQAELHASFVGLNPLHAIHNRRPFNTSPYLPNSMFFRNFIYLDVEGIEDYAGSRRAERLRRRPEICAEIEQLRGAQFVEYERVAALKLRFLKLLFAQFLREWRSTSARAREFHTFVNEGGLLLERFATYCALDEFLHKRDPGLWVWTAWPEEYRDPESPAVREFRLKHWRSVMFYQYLQWQIDLQLRRVQEHARGRGMRIGLYHDLALATDRFGSDLWAHRDFYAAGSRVGSPPDDFSPAGQDWGFPPPNSERHRENGYCLFAESIRRNARHGGALRIDHVMRMFRLYWIPDEMSAADGAYVRERSLDYLRVLALESVRNRFLIVGEDLGTVEPEVRETLAQFGILSYRLFYFERDREGQFLPHDRYVRQALVSSTTHDLPTLAGFWISADIEARRKAGVLDDTAYRSQMDTRAAEKQKMLDVLFRCGLLAPELPREATSYPELTADLHNAIIGFLALTPSELLAINGEDLTKETAQQNLPGTTWQYPNWGRKMRFTLEELRSHPEARGYTAMVRNWIDRSGRAGA
jgi:4-alpha-glucanotransferase